MINTWLITFTAPICGTDTNCLAYCETDPLDRGDFPYEELTEELWDNYSYLLHLEDEEFDSEEEYIEILEQARENWNMDCTFESSLLDEDAVKEYEGYPVIIDERNLHDSTSN